MTKTAGSRTDIPRAARHDLGANHFRPWVRKICEVIVVVGLLNFILFLAGTFYLGGDAWNGKVEGQKYYVWGYHSGQKTYTEVSQAAFGYSMWHVYSVMVTWPLAIIAGFVASQMARHPEA